MIKNADYTKALNTSIEVLKRFNINEAPIDLATIVDQLPNLKVFPYSLFSTSYGCTITELAGILETDLGAISRDSRTNNYLIYYNDTKANKGLDRFTVAHELGHYFLDHFSLITESTIRRGGFSESQYDLLEKEATCFARNLLAPVPLYNRISRDYLEFTWRVIRSFDISYQAAKARRAFLDIDTYRITKDHVDYFNTYKMPSFRNCEYCGNSVVETYGYCTFCRCDNPI